MKTKLIPFTIAGIILICNVLLLFTIKKNKDLLVKKSYENFKNEITIKNLENYIQNIQSNQIGQFLSEGFNLDPNIKKSNKPNYLIARIKQNDCQECIDSIYSSLEKAKDIIGLGHIFIYGDYEDKRDLYIDIVNHSLEGIIYSNIKSGEISLPLDVENISYFYVDDNSKTAKMVFIPQKDSPNLSLNYFGIFKHRFLDYK